MTLLIILLIIAIVFKLFPPRNINSWYGYRTPRSRKNLENWKIANRFAPDFMLAMVTILILVHLAILSLGYNPDNYIPKIMIGGFILLIVLAEKKMN